MQASSTRNWRSSTFLSNRDNHVISSWGICTAHLGQNALFRPVDHSSNPWLWWYPWIPWRQQEVRPPTSSPPPAGWAAPLCRDLLPPPVNAAGPTWPPSPLHTVTVWWTFKTSGRLQCAINIRFQQWSHTQLRSSTFRGCGKSHCGTMLLLAHLVLKSFVHVCMCRTWSRPFLNSVSSCCTSPAWLVAFAISHLSRSRSASSCSMCCCFSFRASCSAVVPEILRAYRADVSVSWKDAARHSTFIHLFFCCLTLEYSCIRLWKLAVHN